MDSAHTSVYLLMTVLALRGGRRQCCTGSTTHPSAHSFWLASVSESARMRTVLSLDPDATSLPSVLNATLETQSLCPYHVGRTQTQ